MEPGRGGCGPQQLIGENLAELDLNKYWSKPNYMQPLRDSSASSVRAGTEHNLQGSAEPRPTAAEAAERLRQRCDKHQTHPRMFAPMFFLLAPLRVRWSLMWLLSVFWSNTCPTLIPRNWKLSHATKYQEEHHRLIKGVSSSF